MEKNEKGHVVATCRNPDGAPTLLALKNEFPERLNILQLDLTIESTIEVILISPFYPPKLNSTQ